jgi:hypothetical protein
VRFLCREGALAKHAIILQAMPVCGTKAARSVYHFLYGAKAIVNFSSSLSQDSPAEQLNRPYKLAYIR